MSKTDYLEIEFLKWCTGQANVLDDGLITPYIGLFTAAPTDAGGGTEATGGAYVRVSSAGKWATPASGQVTNTAAITWPAATASWGTVVAYGLFTASTAGQLLRWGTLSTAKAVGTSDVFSIAAGKIILGED